MSQLSQVKLVPLNTSTDARGSLTAVEGNDHVPFNIKRIFYVYRVQPPYVRAEHAHPDTDQFLIAMAGSLTIDVSDPTATQTYLLDDPSVGLYVPAMLWIRLYEFTPEAVCFVAASTHYVPGDVIRDWETYVRMASSRTAASPVD